MCKIVNVSASVFAQNQTYGSEQEEEKKEERFPEMGRNKELCKNEINSNGSGCLWCIIGWRGNIHRMHGVLLVKTSPGNRPMINLGGWPLGVGGEAIAIHHPADDGPPVR